MAKTDGYITNASDGDWRYSNTGQGNRGDIHDGDVKADAYIRIERSNGPIAGTKVNEQGIVSAGPTVAFNDLNSLLDGASAATGTRPWIVWAGISPMSLSEVLIVWNQAVVLLDQTKVNDGNGAISVAGRVMVVQLGSPVAIDGEETKTVNIAPGAVGAYVDNARIICLPSSNTTVNSPSGDLEPLPTPPSLCSCADPTVGGGSGGQAGGASANVLNATVFAEQLCQSGDCDQSLTTPDLGFVVNNGMKVPTRCCHPFMLQQLFVNGGGGTCPCKPCPVWMACLYVFGATCPLEVFSVDQLVTIGDTNLCHFDELFTTGVPGALHEDANCCGPCKIEIVGNAGPQVLIDAEWRGEIPGVAGQAVDLQYLSTISCSGTPCQSVLEDQSPADTWTEEGILKPVPRVLPVAFFNELKLRTTEITMVTTDTIEAVTSCLTDVITFATGYTFEFITGISKFTSEGQKTALGNAGILNPAWLWNEQPIIVEKDFFEPDAAGSEFVVAGTMLLESVPALVPEFAGWVTEIQSMIIQVCVDGELSDIHVITSILTEQVLPYDITTITAFNPVAAHGYRVFSTRSPDPVSKKVVTADSIDTFLAYDITLDKDIPAVTDLDFSTATVVTGCRLDDDITIGLPDGDHSIDGVLRISPDALYDLIIPKETSPGCDRDFKFVMHEDVPLTWTSIQTEHSTACSPTIHVESGITTIIGGNCNVNPQSLRTCIAMEVPMPNEVNCVGVNLLRANYVSKSETSDTSCPGYDCSPENPPTPPEGSDVPNGGGGPVACGILIRRPRRRPFLKCTG